MEGESSRESAWVVGCKVAYALPLDAHSEVHFAVETRRRVGVRQAANAHTFEVPLM
jgi:hypothetical protein